MSLNELIEFYEIKLATHKDLTPINLKVAECTLKELKGKQSLLGKLNDDMIEKKTCYRYGTHEPIDCDKCERCLKADDLQWNEEDD